MTRPSNDRRPWRSCSSGRPHSGWAIATLLFLFTAAAPLAAQERTGRDLDGLASASPGDSLPPGWSTRTVGEAPPATARVARTDGEPVLRLEADASALQLYRVVDPTLDPAAGRLAWRWRMEGMVPGADLTDPDRDDAPMRVFVVFGEPGLLTRPRTVFYSWGGGDPESRAFLSHVSDRIGVVVLRAGEEMAGRWIPESRDLSADFQGVFGEEPSEPVTAVGLMIDTEQTGTSAASELSSLRWLPR